MRRRDKLRLAFRVSKDVVSTPTVSSSTSITHESSSNRTLQAKTSAPAASPLATSSAAADDRNQALQKAIEEHIATITQEERQSFLTAAQTVTDNTVLEAVRRHNREHEKQSSLRPRLTSVSRFLQCIGRFTDAVAIGISADPNVASIVVGLARGLITVAIEFAEFFDKLTEMATKMIDYLDPFTEYAKSAKHFPSVENALVAVYIDLITFLRSARGVFVDKSGAARTWTSWRVFWRIQWIPFQEEFGTIESSMQHHRQVLHHAAQAVNLEKSRELSEAEVVRRRREQDRDRESFLQWLSTHPSETSHDQIYSKKHSGTGDWLLCHRDFEHWMSFKNSAVLWCYGKPGIGKSVLASNVIEHITSKRALDDHVGVAFFYYDYRLEDTQDLSFVLCALLKQICRASKTIPGGFLKTKQDALPPSQLGNLDAFVEVVRALQLREIFIVIDALDECSRRKRPDVLRFLYDLAHRLDGLKLFVTSRPEPDIRASFMHEIKAPCVAMDVQRVQPDIHRYVAEETQRLRKGAGGRRLNLTDPALETEIINTLTSRSDGMFLWVNLQLIHLCEESESRDDRDVRDALATLPSDLNATYERITNQILSYNTRRQNLAISALHWVMYAQRPMAWRELRNVLAFSETEQAGLERTETIHRQYLFSSCANLLEIPKGSKIVKMIHYSAHEYFTAVFNLEMPGILLSKGEDASHIRKNLAITCIKYLTSTAATMSPVLEDNEIIRPFNDNRFMWYAACHFDGHLDQSAKDPVLMDLVKALLMQSTQTLTTILHFRALKPPPGHEPGRNFVSTVGTFTKIEEEVDATTLIFSTKLYRLPELDGYWKGKQLDPSLLQLACSLGVAEAVEHLLGSGMDVNTKYRDGTSPLYAAAERGQIEIASKLLDHGAEVNTWGGIYNYPLHAAIAACNEGTVRLLLDAGADVQARGDYGTALQVACRYGNRSVTQQVLDSGADVNAQGGRFGWVLREADMVCDRQVIHEAAVGEVDVSAPQYGTPLQEAAFRGQEAIVELLLDRGADINAQGGKYGTALQAASRAAMLSFRTVEADEHEATVKLLLNKGADPNIQGGEDGTALRAAACYGHDAIVELLLDAGADQELQGGQDDSTLQKAAIGGRTITAELLLDRGANINAQGGEYANALQQAALNGNRAMTELLIDRGANINAQGGQYANALQAAAASGYEKVAELLLIKGADINAQGGLYGNALQAAASCDENLENILLWLLDEGVDVNAVSKTVDGTALFAAIAEGKRKTTRLLIDHGADINMKVHGKTALQFARDQVDKPRYPEESHTGGSDCLVDPEEIVQLLLEHGAQEGSTNDQDPSDGNSSDGKSNDDHQPGNAESTVQLTD